MEKIQVSLRSDKNKGYFTWRRFHITVQMWDQGREKRRAHDWVQMWAKDKVQMRTYKQMQGRVLDSENITENWLTSKDAIPSATSGASPWIINIQITEPLTLVRTHDYKLTHCLRSSTQILPRLNPNLNRYKSLISPTPSHAHSCYMIPTLLMSYHTAARLKTTLNSLPSAGAHFREATSWLLHQNGRASVWTFNTWLLHSAVNVEFQWNDGRYVSRCNFMAETNAFCWYLSPCRAQWKTTLSPHNA